MTSSTSRSSRLDLRTTPQQNVVLRQAAKLTDKSLADFILDSAYKVAQQLLLDQRLFLPDGEQGQAFVAQLDRPAQGHLGLQDLLKRPTPWGN